MPGPMAECTFSAFAQGMQGTYVLPPRNDSVRREQSQDVGATTESPAKQAGERRRRTNRPQLAPEVSVTPNPRAGTDRDWTVPVRCWFLTSSRGNVGQGLSTGQHRLPEHPDHARLGKPRRCPSPRSARGCPLLNVDYGLLLFSSEELLLKWCQMKYVLSSKPRQAF